MYISTNKGTAMIPPIRLRLILPIDQKPVMKHYLTASYGAWVQLSLRVSIEQRKLEIIIQLPPTVAWTRSDEEALNGMCVGEEKSLLFWDRVYGEVEQSSADSIIAELLSALQGLVDTPEALRVAYEYHTGSEHDSRQCQICKAICLYKAYQ
jgi:hypothetical protein